MAIQTLNTIKNWFRTGLKPTQAQFWDTWDSFRHKYDKVPVKDVEGIDELLNSKTDQSDFKTINGESLIGNGDISVGGVGSQNLDQVLTNGNRSSQEIFIGEESTQQVQVNDYGVYVSTKDKQWSEFSSNGLYVVTQNEAELSTESSFGNEQLYFSVNGGIKQAFFGHLNGLFLKMGGGGSFNLRSDLVTEGLTVNVPNASGDRIMPLSINGNLADETGNIVIEGAGDAQTLDEVLEKGNTSGKSANIGGVWINPTPGNNVLLGSANTGQGLPNSNYNTIVGIGAGAYASGNYYSSMFGTYAGQSSSGMSNTFLGSFSGNLNSGSGTVGIGINAARSNTNNNVIILSGLKYGDGGNLLPSNDHQFVIGSVADKPIRFNTNVETPLDFNFPSRSGTLATTDDIPPSQSSTLQQVVTKNPIISNGQNIINELGAGRTVLGPGVISISESGTFEKNTHYGSRQIQFLDGTGNHATLWGEGGNGTYFMPNKASGNYTLATTQDIKIGTTPPSSSTDKGEPGEIRVTSSFIYWCAAPNTWFRVNATSF
ncbi:hypothetical protein [Flavobacterium aquidurense]|uniref:Putative bacteriophage tail fiber protein n=1 Tax=Flavobacterium aquidurense TaxID=362413 RepID=A0A0Q0W519_9FLAO|nr:hypothetical protein [Flavobacterium aquidurense]KQB39475.1 putative bacteriophage tail fiber protein [Flavobacterium aquidurense]